MKDEKSIVDTTQKSTHPIAIEGIQFSGPIPPPAILQEYNNICSGCADRIIKYAEDEAELATQRSTRRQKQANFVPVGKLLVKERH